MRIEAPSEVKFAIIREMTVNDNNMLNISWLCEFAGVSRSGYYRWLSAEKTRLERDKCDAADFDVILTAYRFRGRAKGARSIYMRLLHMGIRMNVKKIRRLMNKYGLRCPIRKANPYRRMAKAMRTNRVAPNVVNRDFTGNGARKVLLTDITYLRYREGFCFLSTILDAFTREILAYKVSDNFDVGFVIETVESLVQNHDATLDDSAIIHSDQGCHYTSKRFIEKLSDAHFVQSMSRRGNCWDNAPQESFFGHLKDEVGDDIAEGETFEQVQAIVDDQIDYYNNDRYQWDLLKLSPREYYVYVTTGVYPLEKYHRQKDTGTAVPEV